MNHAISIVLVALCACLLASPVPEYSTGVKNAAQSGSNNIINTNTKQQPSLESNNTDGDDDGEDMETADMIIFRPLFVYRKRTAQKYRVNTANRRNDRPQYGYGY
ncbi:uncharacterized protein LOC126885275 [Diabrotica virgifera virgifera]|uniref:Secreted protein n=1 Tax=Diabrotica virgifera virgifera TaxID=50390 RepID=A0ABM5KC03_DIAVI|nr:uncharacterized protein LOC126885275 [Diabrotica virgifera virgifera]